MFAFIGFIVWTVVIFAAGMKVQSEISELDDSSGTGQFIDECSDNTRSLIRDL